MYICAVADDVVGDHHDGHHHHRYHHSHQLHHDLALFGSVRVSVVVDDVVLGEVACPLNIVPTYGSLVNGRQRNGGEKYGEKDKKRLHCGLFSARL